MNKSTEISNFVIYTSPKDGNIKINVKLDNETIWLTQKQLAELFNIDRTVITKHLKNIFESEELEENLTSANFALVQKEGIRQVERELVFYNLDVIIAVGYRVNSIQATHFRMWATKILKEYIVKGYSINSDIIQKNYNEFLRTVEDIKLLALDNNLIQKTEVIDLIRVFAETWLSLEAYDKDNLLSIGITKKQISCAVKDFKEDLQKLKQELIRKNEATELFATERQVNNLEGIFGNIMQSFDGVYLYESVEEKAGNLLYFMVKNHPFIDGNKRSGAFAFVWFLKQNNILNLNKITPELLTTLTLLIAESNPKDKEKVVKLTLQLLK